MSVLVLVEHDGKPIKDATLATVTAASKLGEVHALVVGNNVDGVAQAAAKIAGVAKVLCRQARPRSSISLPKPSRRSRPS